MEADTDPQELYDLILERRRKTEAERLKPAQIRLWDGDMNLRGEVAGERKGEFEFIENDTGTASLELPLTHYLARWVMNHKGRSKRNVLVSFDKQGARWMGTMDHYRVVRTKEGDRYLEIVFKHDYEHVKHILCWSNPFLRPELQFPKLWVVFGPARWSLLLTLFVNVLRLETSLWTLPDNPLDLSEWMGLSFLPWNWRHVVKPFAILNDNSNLAIAFSRFQTWHDVAKDVLADGQLTVTCRRYLHGEDEHPFKDIGGIFDLIDDDFIHDFVDSLDLPNDEAAEALAGYLADPLTIIPLRHGAIVWDIVDNSGWGEETAFGGSLLTGLIRSVVTIASDGTTEGVDVFTGDPTFPREYYAPGYLGTSPNAPWVVFEEGPLTGIENSEFMYYEATDTSVVGGGHSVPGVNEAISAGINIGGDFLTSFINSQIAMAASVSGGLGVNVGAPAIDLPPLGGLMDAVLAPLYTDVFLAFMEVPTLRAAGMNLPIAGLENVTSSLGDFHYYEGWAEGMDKAFTLSATMAARAKIWATRTRTAHTIEIADAAPYIFGEKGYGHCWLGSRVGTAPLDYPIPHTVFVERISKLKYSWDKDGPKGWKATVGYREPNDPALKALEYIRRVNSILGQLGIL